MWLHRLVIIRPAPEGDGRTTPEQTGQYSHYNTKLAIFSHITLTVPPSRPSCSWNSREHCHLLCIWINAIARNGDINWPAIFMHVPPTVQSMCWFNCSNHDVTKVGGSPATVHTCNDYSGSNVRSFFPRWGRHDTIYYYYLRYDTVTDCNYESSCWVH